MKKLIKLLVVLFVWCYSINAQQLNSNIQEKRKLLSQQFEKELIKITDNIYVAVGYGASNPVLIKGKDSLIIVDAMYCTESAENVLSEFCKISEKPIKAIIYTHMHADHIGGASVFAKESNPVIYARMVDKHSQPGYEELSDILEKRAKRQFGFDLPLNEKFDGISPVYRSQVGCAEGKMKPTYLFKEERLKLNISGISLELIAAPGETDDHLYVWLPESKTLICGDNFYYSFPNLYALRGTQYRDVSKWVSSLDKMINENAEFLISGHARPIIGQENVRNTLTDYRNTLSFVLNETLKGINNGLSPEQLAVTVRLPDSLACKGYLQEFYGVIGWSVKSIYTGYVGWFDGNPTNLFPLLPKEEAVRIKELIGSDEQFLNKIKASIEEEDYQWACQLADYFLVLKPGANEVKILKAKALQALAKKQISSNARHYYLSVAKELFDEVNYTKPTKKLD